MFVPSLPSCIGSQSRPTFGDDFILVRAIYTYHKKKFTLIKIIKSNPMKIPFFLNENEIKEVYIDDVTGSMLDCI